MNMLTLTCQLGIGTIVEMKSLRPGDPLVLYATLLLVFANGIGYLQVNVQV